MLLLLIVVVVSARRTYRTRGCQSWACGVLHLGHLQDLLREVTCVPSTHPLVGTRRAKGEATNRVTYQARASRRRCWGQASSPSSHQYTAGGAGAWAEPPGPSQPPGERVSWRRRQGLERRQQPETHMVMMPGSGPGHAIMFSVTLHHQQRCCIGRDPHLGSTGLHDKGSLHCLL